MCEIDSMTPLSGCTASDSHDPLSDSRPDTWEYVVGIFLIWSWGGGSPVHQNHLSSFEIMPCEGAFVGK